MPPRRRQNATQTATQTATPTPPSSRRRTVPIAEHEALKKRFIDKARELAEEHDWCHVVEDALIELGLVNELKNSDCKIGDVVIDSEVDYTDDNINVAFIKVGDDNWIRMNTTTYTLYYVSGLPFKEVLEHSNNGRVKKWVM